MKSHAAATLAIETRVIGKAVVLEVSGEVVVTTGETLRGAVEGAIETGGPHVVLDLERLSHIDTPGLALLYRLHERVAAEGGALAIAALPEPFRDLVQRVHLDHRLHLWPTVAAALDDHGR